MGILESFGVKEGQGKYYEEAVYSLVLIYNTLYDSVSRYLEPHGLTPGKLNILLAIKHQGGAEGIRQVELSKRLIVTPSNMTKLIDKLEKEGLVTRSALAGDRRVNLMKITPQGTKLLDEVWAGYNQKLKDLVGVLPLARQKELSRTLLQWFGILKIKQENR